MNTAVLFGLPYRLFCCFRSTCFGASSWMSRAALCRTGSDSSAPPGTAKSKTSRRYRICLADRYISIMALSWAIKKHVWTIELTSIFLLLFPPRFSTVH